jgi:hypothetical protein
MDDGQKARVAELDNWVIFWEAEEGVAPSAPD